jgi:hypothetical protein
MRKSSHIFQYGDCLRKTEDSSFGLMQCDILSALGHGSAMSERQDQSHKQRENIAFEKHVYYRNNQYAVPLFGRFTMKEIVRYSDFTLKVEARERRTWGTNS